MPIEPETKLCSFCQSDERVYGLACARCREILRKWSHQKFKGSGLELPPHELDVIEKKTLDRWREWVKTMDGGDGMYGFDRQKAIDNIFDAAWVGMKKAKSTKKSYDATIVKTLRNLADRIENDHSPVAFFRRP